VNFKINDTFGLRSDIALAVADAGNRPCTSRGRRYKLLCISGLLTSAKSVGFEAGRVEKSVIATRQRTLIINSDIVVC